MLETVLNFRDFGGYAVEGGGRVRRGLLYRSAQLADASPADVERISGLGLSVIVDLRRPGERRNQPTGGWTGAFEVIATDIGGDDDPWLVFLRAGDVSAQAFVGFADRFYKASPFEDRHVDLFSRYFHALAGAEGAVLVHCAAGKDRTGVAVALTQALLGVRPDDILDDYMLTGRVATYEVHGAMVAAMLERLSGRRPAEDAVRAAMGVRADNVRNVFAAIEDRCGSLDAYFEQVLGLAPETRAAIRARLVEPA